MIATLVNQAHPLAGFVLLLLALAAALSLTSLPAVRAAAGAVRQPGLRQVLRSPSSVQQPFLSLLMKGRGRVLALAGVAGVVGLVGLGSIGLVAFDSRVRSERDASGQIQSRDKRISELEAELDLTRRQGQEALAARDAVHAAEARKTGEAHAAAMQKLRQDHERATADLRAQFDQVLAERGKSDQTQATLHQLEKEVLEQAKQGLQRELAFANDIIRRHEATIDDLRRALKAAKP